MPTAAQTKFNSGEATALLLGQTDNPVYATSLRRALNCMVTPQGPLMRRTGTRRAGPAASTASETISWVFDVGDAYDLEFGNYYVRFWRQDGSQVMAGTVPYQVATPWTQAQAEQLRWEQSADVMWLVHPDVPMQQLNRTALYPNEAFTLAAAVFTDGPYYPEDLTGNTMTPGGTGTGVIQINSSAPAFAATDVGRFFRINLGTSGGTPDNQGWAWGTITRFDNTQQVQVNFATRVNSTGPAGAGMWRLGLYGSATGYPNSIRIHQERLILGSTVANSFPRGDGSNSGKFLTFTPGPDDDQALEMVIAGNKVPLIRDIQSLAVLVIITANGATAVTSSSGVPLAALTPTSMTLLNIPTSTGGNDVPSIKGQGSVLYLDPQGRSLGEIRAPNPAFPDTLVYREITIRSEHLLRSSPGIAMAWADKPYSQIVIVRADGSFLLGAYNPEQEVIAFTPHVLSGATVLDVATLPTLDGDQIWLLTNRNGALTMEAMTYTLRDTDPDREAVNLDNATTWRDAPAATLTYVSTDGNGIQTWQASAGVFAPSDAGRAVRTLVMSTPDATDDLNMPQWSQCSLRIQTVSSDGTTITAAVEGAAPQSPVAAGGWTRTAKVIPGFDVFDGQSIGVLADGWDPGPLPVTGGSIILPREASVVTGGLTYPSHAQPMPPSPQTKKGGAVGRPTISPATRLRVVRSAGVKQRCWDGVARNMAPLRFGQMATDMPPPFYTGDLELDTATESNTPVAAWIVANGSQPFAIAGFAPEVEIGEAG